MVSSAISAKALEFLGEIGCSEAGIIVLNDKYNPDTQRGIMRINHRSLDHLRASLALIDKIDGQDVIVRSIGASGILKKAEGNYLAA